MIVRSQHVQGRGILTINTEDPGSRVEKRRRAVSDNSENSLLFESVSDPNDLNIYAGIFLWEQEDNSFHLREKNPVAEGPLNSLYKTSTDRDYKKLLHSIWVLGSARNTSIFNVNAPKLTVPSLPCMGGITTILNTGEYDIFPGDQIVLRLPKKERQNQGPKDGSFRVSDKCRYLETIPLRVLMPYVERILNEQIKLIGAVNNNIGGDDGRRKAQLAYQVIRSWPGCCIVAMAEQQAPPGFFLDVQITPSGRIPRWEKENSAPTPFLWE